MPNIKKVIRDALEQSETPRDFGFGDAVSLGEHKLDDLVGALPPGQTALLWCNVPQLASAWALHAVSENALRAGIPSLYVSNHVSVGEVAGRLIAAGSNVSLANLRLGCLDEQGQEDVARISSSIARADLNLEFIRSSEQLATVLGESNSAFACIDCRLTSDIRPTDVLEIATSASQPSVATLVCVSASGLEADYELHELADVVIRVRVVDGTRKTGCPLVKATLLKSPLGRLDDISARWCPESSAIRCGRW